MVHTEILETPSIKPGQGVWTAYGSASIDAPAREVWTAVTDLQSWGKWNLYTPKVDTPSGTNVVQVGDRVTVHYRPDTTGSIMAVPCLAMAVSDEDMTFCWRGEVAGIPTWVLLPEKVHRVTTTGETKCFYEIFETQSGPMAYLVKWGMGAKQSAMNQGIADAIKKYVEGRK